MARKDKREPSPSKDATKDASKSSRNCAEKAASRSLPNAKPSPKSSAGAKANRFSNMNEQLASLGLKLRVVLGDGNCLFRALGDQLEGHTRKHLDYRRQTVKYMTENREFFEPFIEDTTSFDRHVALLSEPGTHAGNDAIVAFAGSFEAVVVVHQLNTPLYHIGLHGGDKKRPPQWELHVAYHSGDHYDSIRKFDEPDGLEYPASIHIPTIIKNPVSDVKPPAASVKINLPDGGFGFPPFDPLKPSSLWGQNGSGRRIFGDESATLALTLPTPGSPTSVPRHCEKKRRRSALGAEARHASGSDDDRIEEVRSQLDKLGWSETFTSR